MVMGRAYTEEERIEIRKKLMDAGLELFHDNNVKRLSITEVTGRAGIAQGGFYNFFESKEELIAEIMAYRLKQKLDLLEDHFYLSLDDPAQFLINVIYENSMDMRRKAQQKEMYRQLQLFTEAGKDVQKKMASAIEECLKDLQNYLADHGKTVSMDIEGILEVIFGGTAMYYHADLMKPEYFEQIYRTYLSSNIRNYIR